MEARNPAGCAQCGKTSHYASECRTWTVCCECGRPAHPFTRDIPRDGAWSCLDCKDPQWRTRLDRADPRYREPGAPVRLPYVGKPVTEAPPVERREIVAAQVAESRAGRAVI